METQAHCDNVPGDAAKLAAMLRMLLKISDATEEEFRFIFTEAGRGVRDADRMSSEIACYWMGRRIGRVVDRH